MKSNQERSNECLPPKKREIPACTLASDERPLTVAPAGESQRGGNLAWLASVASGQHASSAGEPFSPQYKPLTAPEPSLSLPSSSSIPSSLLPRAATTLPAIYTSPISHPGGALQYNPLPTNLHFISPAYGAPYASYISSPLASQRPHADPYATTANPAASKLNQHHPLGRPLPGLADGAPPPHSAQYVQLASGGPRTAHSPHGHLPLHMHPHHTLSLGASSPVLLQYPHDGPGAKKEEARPREVLNGELDKGRRFETGSGKQGGTGKVPASTQHHQLHQHSAHQYEARHVVLPAEYGHDGASALRPSLVLVPNSHGPGAADPRGSPDKLPSSLAHSEKGSICMGKPMARPPSSSSGAPPPFPLPPACVESPKVAAPTLSPHTVIQTTPNATDALPLGLPSANFYSAQPPIIGYIAGAGQQAPLGYHASLPQHLLIPGTQPVIIPVSGAGAPALEGAVTSTSPPFPTALPHTFVTAAPKVEPFETPTAYANPAGGAVVQAQLHLPVVSAPAGVLTSPPPPPSAPSLPPYFAKGSIIQLADGELKRVEDLKTEDFIQSAEISSELKIDSSTVERIDGSHTPNFAIIQFAVGEHRSQVSVEVLVEYPFFVFGQGWSSCCPDRTTQLLELSCTKLSVGDVCISLTLKNLKNGSLKKSQGPPPEGPVLGPPPKPPKASSAGARGGAGTGSGRTDSASGGAARTGGEEAEPTWRTEKFDPGRGSPAGPLGPWGWSRAAGRRDARGGGRPLRDARWRNRTRSRP